MIHQTPDPIRVMWTGDPRAYERYWMVCHDPKGEVLVATGSSFYPNLDRAEAYAIVNHRGRHSTVRAFRALGADRADLRLGPIAPQIIRGMRWWRYILEPNEWGVSYQLDFRDTTRQMFREPLSDTAGGSPEGSPQRRDHRVRELRRGRRLGRGRRHPHRDSLPGHPGTRDRHWGVGRGVGGPAMSLGGRLHVGVSGNAFVAFPSLDPVGRSGLSPLRRRKQGHGPGGQADAAAALRTRHPRVRRGDRRLHARHRRDQAGPLRTHRQPDRLPALRHVRRHPRPGHPSGRIRRARPGRRRDLRREPACCPGGRSPGWTSTCAAAPATARSPPASTNPSTPPPTRCAPPAGPAGRSWTERSSEGRAGSVPHRAGRRAGDGARPGAGQLGRQRQGSVVLHGPLGRTRAALRDAGQGGGRPARDGARPRVRHHRSAGGVRRARAGGTVVGRDRRVDRRAVLRHRLGSGHGRHPGAAPARTRPRHCAGGARTGRRGRSAARRPHRAGSATWPPPPQRLPPPNSSRCGPTSSSDTGSNPTRCSPTPSPGWQTRSRWRSGYRSCTATCASATCSTTAATSPHCSTGRWSTSATRSKTSAGSTARCGARCTRCPSTVPRRLRSRRRRPGRP